MFVNNVHSARYQVTEEQWNDWKENWLKNLAIAVSPALKKYDVMWGSEVHSPAPTELYLSLVKEVNNPYVGLVADLAAWMYDPSVLGAEQSMIENFKACLPYIKHVHAHNIGASIWMNHTLGNMEYPQDKLISLLVESGYSGYITAEVGGESSALETKRTIEECVKLIKNCF